jgi:hypothetical protein
VVIRGELRRECIEVVRVGSQPMDAYQRRLTLRSVIQMMEREAV